MRIDRTKFHEEASKYLGERLSQWQSTHQQAPHALGLYYHQQLVARYSELIPEGCSILEIGCGKGALLNSLKPTRGVGVDFCAAAIEHARESFPHLEFIQCEASNLELPGQTFDYIILSDLIGDLWDVQAVFENLHNLCSPRTRLIFNFFSHLWTLPISVARKMRLAKKMLSQNWMTTKDLENLLALSGFQSLRSWREIALPVNIPFIAKLTNKYLVRLFPFNHLSLTNFLIARPRIPAEESSPTVSVVIAARNESGHIREIIHRIPDMGSSTEIIFVEGNSQDDTYQVIAQAITEYPKKTIRLLKQPGKGKGDAVRCGFSSATGDVLMILDADITVPPEDLTRFLEPLKSGTAEFINGVRLVYPMDKKAMRFLNMAGNKLFSWAFSWLLGQPIRDTLCGTKVLWREDYERIAKNRSYFGNFDPFGDFDLLFGAAKLDLQIIEVPVRYRARRYGETNISRWRHGWLLLKMVVFAANKIKFR
ncbi:MAG: glycosyltransferase [Gammaproteobacteria bacterium]